MKNTNLIAILSFTVLSCSTGIDTEKLATTYDCEQIIIGQAFSVSTEDESYKELNITALNCSDIDFNNKDQIHNMGIDIAFSAYSMLENPDSSVNRINVIIENSDNELTVEIDFDEFLAYTAFDYLQREVYDSAIALYNKIIDINPTSKHYTNRGAGYLELKEYDLAISDFMKANETTPNDYTYIKNVGVGYYEKGDFNMAIEWQNKAISIDQNRHSAYGELGKIYLKLKDYQKSVDYLEKAILLDSTAYFWNRRLGIALFELQQFDKSITHLTKSIENEDGHPELLIYRGKAYLELGNKDLACIDFKAAKEKNQKEANELAKENCI